MHITHTFQARATNGWSSLGSDESWSVVMAPETRGVKRSSRESLPNVIIALKSTKVSSHAGTKIRDTRLSRNYAIDVVTTMTTRNAKSQPGISVIPHPKVTLSAKKQDVELSRTKTDQVRAQAATFARAVKFRVFLCCGIQVLLISVFELEQVKEIKSSSEMISIPIRKTPITSATSKPHVHLATIKHMKTEHAGQKITSAKTAPIMSTTSKPHVHLATVKHMKTEHAGQKIASAKTSVIKFHAIEKVPKKCRAVEVPKKSSSVIKSSKAVTPKTALKGSSVVVTKKRLREVSTGAKPTVATRRTLTAAALKKLAPVVQKATRAKKPKPFEFKGSEWSGNSDDEGIINN